jgi:hypothetical protein
MGGFGRRRWRGYGGRWGSRAVVPLQDVDRDRELPRGVANDELLLREK